MFSRTVIKLSGEALAGDSGKFFDDTIIDSVIRQIKTVLENGTQIALILGGGNFWRGRTRPDMDRVKADHIGMLGTVMNGLYLQDAFRRGGVKARVATPAAFGNFTDIYARDTALEWMAQGTVVINTAGLGHPFFSTDTITALRAAELGADCVLYAKSVSGVYERDPSVFPEARKFKNVSYNTVITQSLNAADIAAMHLTRDEKIPSYVFLMDERDSIVNACSYPITGPQQGTYISESIKEDQFYV